MDDMTGQTGENTDNKEEIIQDNTQATETERQDGTDFNEEHTAVPEQSPPPEAKEEDKKETKKKGVTKVPLFAAIIAALAVAVLTSQITFLTVRQSYHSKLATISRENFSNDKLSELEELYRKYYVGEINEEQLEYGLIEGYIYGTGDRYGSYMSKEEYDDYLESMKSKAVGIGVYVSWNDDYGCIEVLEVYEGSPAEAAGLSEGDFIVEVDGQSVAELGYTPAVEKVRGAIGTKVKLTVARYGEENYLSFEITRAEYVSKTVKTKVYDNVAVIAISNFYYDTPTELKAAVEKIKQQGCDRIVFDLRNNTGGVLGSIQGVLDYILPEGPIVRMIDANGKTSTIYSDASCLEMPMVVVVNGHTASAAELFTSALRDYGYATIVGTQTFGKGTVTSPYPLSDGSVVYISSELYYPPRSDNFEGVGITPDVIVELNEEAANTNLHKLPLEKDDQLKKAVEIIKEK